MLLVSLFSLDDDPPPSPFDFGLDLPLALIVSTLEDGELLTNGLGCCCCLCFAAIICPSNDIAPLELLVDLCCEDVMERDNNGSRRKLCMLRCTARGGVDVVGRESMPSVIVNRRLLGDDKLLYFVNVSLLFSFVLLCGLFLLLVAAVTVVEVEVILCS